jgi:hypothetical protein
MGSKQPVSWFDYRQACREWQEKNRASRWHRWADSPWPWLLLGVLGFGLSAWIWYRVLSRVEVF